MDYQIGSPPIPIPIELVFQPTESRMPIAIDIFDDTRLEGPEDFILFLTIPANPAQGYLLGTIPSTTIRIVDNDGNVINFVKFMIRTV